MLCESDGTYALSGRGWQRLAVKPPLRALRPPGAIGVLVESAETPIPVNGR